MRGNKIPDESNWQDPNLDLQSEANAPVYWTTQFDKRNGWDLQFGCLDKKNSTRSKKIIWCQIRGTQIWLLI